MTGTDIELIEAPARTLFRTDDPAEVLEAARQVASALKDALVKGEMVQRISGREHVKIDGWQTLGSMLGVSPYVVWSRPVEDGWEARAEARTVDGRTVGAAEAMCLHTERNWRGRDEYALRSMAQTRAMSKALRAPLGFIVALGGYSTTPSEEADAESYGPAAKPRDLMNLKRAIEVLYGAEVPAGMVERLIADAGGYMPKIVARAVQLVAAQRPVAPAPSPEADPTAIEPEPVVEVEAEEAEPTTEQ